MKWSISLGKFAGIKVQVHITFLVLLIWIGLSLWSAQQSLWTALNGVSFVLALFLCVLLHEYGHALTARQFGVKTRDITLLPIGGVARLERMPDKPIQELLTAVAGPAVNVAISIILILGIAIAGRPFSPAAIAASSSGLTGPGFIERLIFVNILLVVFNMLPAFPMDGGRVLRALLAMKFEFARATRIATTIAKVFAIIFAIVGFYTNPFLMLIALVVWMGASQESSAAQMKGVLDGITVSQAMMTDFRTLSINDSLSHAVELLISGSQHDFPVIQDGQVVGILPRHILIASLSRHEESNPVSSVMLGNITFVDSSAMLEDVLPQLQRSVVKTVPVYSHGRLVGVLTMENVGEFVSVQSALIRVLPTKQ